MSGYPPLGARGRHGDTTGGTQGSGPGRPGGTGRGSWAEMLSSSLPKCWKKNILEIIL